MPGPAGQLLTTAVDAGPDARASQPLPRPRPRHRRHAASPATHGDGPARAGAQPHLRRRAGPADRSASTGSRLRARASAPGSLAALAFVAIAFGREHRRLARQPRRQRPSGAGRGGRSALLLIARRRHAAVPVVPSPPPAGVVVARLRRLACRCSAGSWSPLGLDAFFRFSSSFGDTYGPLAGMIGVDAVGAAVGHRRPLRRGGRRAARGRPGRRGRDRRTRTRSPSQSPTPVTAAACHGAVETVGAR